MRKKLLFDVSVLENGLAANAARSGIFVASFEIFRALRRCGDFEMVAYVEPWAEQTLCAFFKTLGDIGDLKIVRGYGEDDFQRFSSCMRAYHAGISLIEANSLGIKLLRGTFCLGLFAFRKFSGLCHRVKSNRWCKRIKDDYAAFFSTVFASPEAIVRAGIPRFTILYDTIPLLFPQYYPQPEGGKMWMEILAESLTDADWGFAISECTKRDYLRFAPGLRADHVKVIPLGAAERFYPCSDSRRIAETLAKYGIPSDRPYFLSLCTIEPRKNLPFAIRAFAEFAKADQSAVFVLAGGGWLNYREAWEETLREFSDIRDRIILPGYVADEDLAPLYSGAIAFVYLSLYEGFGLPPLEAMQCGCPVLSSNSSSLPEVVGDAALTVAPDDLPHAVEAMRRLATEEDLRKDLRDRGLKRARLFNWDAAAEIIARTMKDVVK